MKYIDMWFKDFLGKQSKQDGTRRGRVKELCFLLFSQSFIILALCHFHLGLPCYKILVPSYSVFSENEDI